MPTKTAPAKNTVRLSANPSQMLEIALTINPKSSIGFRPRRSVSAPPIVLPMMLATEKVPKIRPTVVMPTPNLLVTYSVKNGNRMNPPSRSIKEAIIKIQKLRGYSLMAARRRQ